MEGATSASDSKQGKEEDVCYEIFLETSLIGVNNVRKWENVNKDVGDRIWSAFENMGMGNMKERNNISKKMGVMEKEELESGVVRKEIIPLVQ